MTAARSGEFESSGKPVLTMSSWGALWLVELSGASENYWSQLRSKGRMKVLDLESSAGRVHARIVDRRGEIHGVDIEVRRLSSGERDDVIALAGRRSGTLAALLDGSVPAVLVDEITELEIDLFPTPSDLRISCRCDQWSDPCPHASAVLRALADAMDRDPFMLFELRGLPRADMLTAIRHQRGTPNGSVIDEPIVDPWEGWPLERTVPVAVPRGSWALSPSAADGDLVDELATTVSDPVLGSDGERARSEAIQRARVLLRQWREPRRDPGDGT